MSKNETHTTQNSTLKDSENSKQITTIPNKNNTPNLKQSGRKAWDLTNDELDELQRDINKVLSKYTHKPNILISYSYLFLSLFQLCICYISMLYLISLEILPQSILLIIYAITAGQPATGCWVIAHEAGHSAFGPTELQNDIPGFIIHSLLLVPQQSWKMSHAKHHSNTNALVTGETHVPELKEQVQHELDIKEAFDHAFEDAFVIVKTLGMLLLGWPLQLLFNTSGGRVNADDMKTPLSRGLAGVLNKSHFLGSSEVMHDKLGYKVILSTVGCLVTLYCVISQMEDPLFWYFGPQIVVNANLVGITYLQHTHPDVPHMGVDAFRFLKGALCTIDRPINPIINHLHHNISSTHVLHHINSRIPHYRAVEATIALKQVLGDLYNQDGRDVVTAMLDTKRKCDQVDSVQGLQFQKS